MKQLTGWKKKWGALSLALLLTAGLAACGDKDGAQTAASPAASSAAAVQESAKPEASPSASPTAAAAQTVYPLTVKDASGTDVTFEKAPERVVTLAPSETEVLFAVGSGAKVVGVDQYSDYPEEAKAKAKVGDMKTNIEAVLAQKPDVVFAHNSMQKEAIQKLRDLKITVFASDPSTYDQVIEKVETVGKIMNLQEQAGKVAEQMKADRDRVVAAVKDAPKKKVYMEFSPGWTVGKGEFMDELVALAGGQNVAGDKEGWFEINAEAVIKSNPDVILFSNGSKMGNAIQDEILKRPGFAGLTAVKDKKMYGINEDIVSRVSPRLSQALVEMAKAIHPDLVK